MTATISATAVYLIAALGFRSRLHGGALEPLIGLATEAASDCLPFGATGRPMSRPMAGCCSNVGVAIGELTLVAASAGWLVRRRRGITTK